MSKTARIRRVQARLRKIGWPVKPDGVKGPQTRQAIREFQRGYARAKLPVDGEVRRISRTYRAIRWSASHGGRCSRHYKYSEFASKGNGDVSVDRRLVLGLEKYRARVGHGVAIVSGYRDPAHNRRVGGATSSQHMTGKAADIRPELSVAQVRALGVFNGIGYDGNTGRVRHVDVRDQKATWRYG
jgi:peptidoglycan hydrolase-like protein with peptidoglycan-binding domain